MNRLNRSVSVAAICFAAICFAANSAVAGDPVSRCRTPDPIACLITAASDPDFDVQSPLASSWIDSVRRRGTAGLDELLDRLSPEQREIATIKQVIDRVAAQKDASTSRLYWHTSLDDAKAVSKATGKPILSLRLLGRLDEERSCANSRFFRTTLYPVTTVSKRLRSHYVLHWQSVREVPLVTIDMGQGRTLVQPIIGNSVHLMLDSNGVAIDAMPGLVTAERFVQWLQETDDLWRRLQSLDSGLHHSLIARHHGDRAAKRRSESRLAIAADQAVHDVNPFDRGWVELAQHEVSGGKLVVKVEQPIAEVAMVTTVGKSAVETPLLRAVMQSESMIARDTVFNLYVLQTRIDDWFADADALMTESQLTPRIYANVFLMPLDDPWLGLSRDEAFVAIGRDGKATSTKMESPLGRLPQSSDSH
ncbi:hypothetical protein Poly51_19960 [Rubripirellula tenax]|uniref:Uncharacterized protein n=1 Tax=Rubripirellula tenax TaxID=2528015 RepID=A0A5C6FF95_9BACT|nr:hypothetical protein [Rubripirellula tenax]TWU59210.1 hypothetical protein Poly51_19960 [Rubripirellula tenax]